MSSPTIVLVTGANQGIGFAVAKQLCDHDNYHILLGSRNAERGAKAATEIDPSGTRVEPVTIDVADDASIQSAAEYVAKKYGHLDVLVNNAGVNNELALFWKHQNSRNQEPSSLLELRQLYRDAYEVNLFGAAITTEAFTPLLEKSVAHPARIVFVSSHTGSLSLRTDPSTEFYAKMKTPSFPIYRSSKSALNLLMLHYAAKFQDRGWKVNGSCPNLTNTGFSGNSGIGRPASESAVNIVRLATLSSDGEHGVYSDENGIVPW
ncbi:hypothetical protein N7492_003904 [Penicillium capsulatum]|uniref:Uncharacterized protein n=1 Tax=Penicillium capsulatum TaxID=69766 RepID=A0A9W9IMR8_9EURO|nr:hypothetical protein N7492_003904 [Penicillium capsulatum]KAJ6121516.1 hypothetical protein N7512_003981 [Penicillium capsulatum]